MHGLSFYFPLKSCFARLRYSNRIVVSIKWPLIFIVIKVLGIILNALLSVTCSYLITYPRYAGLKVCLLLELVAVTNMQSLLAMNNS